MKNQRQPISFLATDDPDRAQEFFSTVLGLRLFETSPFALAFWDGDHMLRVQIVPEFPPATYTVYGWQVINIIAEIEALISKGVQFQSFDHLPQDENGIWTSPDGHQITWFNDPCGNILSLTQYAKK